MAAMRQLLLMRHAKSSWDDPKLSDHARPLNARGRLSAVAMRRVMRELELAPEVVLVSSARRTLQTLEALEPWDDTPAVEPMDALYLAPPDQLFDALRRVTGSIRSVLLLGHNPGMHDFALDLVGQEADLVGHAELRRLSEGFPTGALAVFDIRDEWSGLAAGAGVLTRFLIPRDLPELAAS